MAPGYAGILFVFVFVARLVLDTGSCAPRVVWNDLELLLLLPPPPKCPPCQICVVLGFEPKCFFTNLPARQTLHQLDIPSPPYLSYVNVLRLTAQPDLRGNVQVLNITVLTVLCLCKYTRLFSAPSRSRAPIFHG